MLWDVAEPGDAGGRELDGGVKAAGDGLLDDDLLAFLQQLDLPFLDGNGLVDLGGFLVEEFGD